MRNKLKRLIAKRPPLQSLQERGLLRGEVGWPRGCLSPSCLRSVFTFLIWASAHFMDEKTSVRLRVEFLFRDCCFSHSCSLLGGGYTSLYRPRTGSQEGQPSFGVKACAEKSYPG